MGEILRFDYYYGAEAEQFSFYRVPRLLIKDDRFRDLSSDAKLLYGLMLDRMALSVKNRWFDAENRAYIYYTLDNIMEDLGCGREKCSKVLSELDDKKGIGLIRKKRQGQGRPDLIYVMNFASLEPAKPDAEPEVRKSNFKKFDGQEARSSETELQEVRESNSKKFGNRDSTSTEIELPEVRESNYNKNNTDYNDMSYTDPIYQLMAAEKNAAASKPGKLSKPIDMIDGEKENVELVKENLEIDEHLQNAAGFPDIDLYTEIFEIIRDVVGIEQESVRIAGRDFPYRLVKERFLQLKTEHVDYVISCMKEHTGPIGNIRAYLLTALYNAPTTINHYYTHKVKQNSYGWG